MVFNFLFIWLCRESYLRSTPEGFYLPKIKICVCKIKLNLWKVRKQKYQFTNSSSYVYFKLLSEAYL